MKVTSFSSKIACNLIDYVHQQGCDVAELYELFALPKEYHNREDIRIPSSKMSLIWQKAIELTGNEDIGFQMGIEFNTAALRTTNLIMQSSPTVYNAFVQGIQYSELIASVLSMEIGEVDNHIYIEFTPKKEWTLEPAVVVKDCLNITFVSMLFSVQQLTGVFHAPSVLCFSYRKPKNLATYYRTFNCHIAFGQPYNRIGFPKNLVKGSIATQDQGLLAVLKKHADDLKQSFSHEQPFVARTQKLIIELMDPHPPTLETVAQSLHLSPRSLQRKIKQEQGVSYTALVDTIRKQLCAKYLEDPQRTVDEIGFLSGYADTASFIRAFKRWYGKTPRQMNQKVHLGR